MHPCSTCKRHIRDRENTCPFCGTVQRSTEPPSAVTLGAFALALAFLGTAACSADKSTADAAGSTTQGSSAEGSSTEGSTTVDDTSDSGMTSTETDTDDGPTDTSASSGSFYAGPTVDVGAETQCDPFVQDCPDGEKCVPYAMSGESWDRNTCVPILGDGKPGDACSYDGPATATDDCDGSSLCWNEVCTAFCKGSPDNPQCAEQTVCMISNAGSVTLCVDPCDPIAQDCADPWVCHLSYYGFVCMPAHQEIPVGEPCETMNDCVAGAACVDAALLPDCAGPSCCVEYCSIAEPLCATPGSECVSFFADDPPAGYEDVGICVVPE